MPDLEYLVVYWMNMPFAVFLPFVLLIACSIFIIYEMTMLRRRLTSANNSDINRRREKRDLDYAITILSMGVVFLIFFFPYTFIIIVANYFLYNQDVANVFFYLYYIGFGNNIIVYFCFNKSFRNTLIACCSQNANGLA